MKRIEKIKQTLQALATELKIKNISGVDKVVEERATLILRGFGVNDRVSLYDLDTDANFNKYGKKIKDHLGNFVSQLCGLMVSDKMLNDYAVDVFCLLMPEYMQAHLGGVKWNIENSVVRPTGIKPIEDTKKALRDFLAKCLVSDEKDGIEDLIDFFGITIYNNIVVSRPIGLKEVNSFEVTLGPEGKVLGQKSTVGGKEIRPGLVLGHIGGGMGFGNSVDADAHMMITDLYRTDGIFVGKKESRMEDKAVATYQSRPDTNFEKEHAKTLGYTNAREQDSVPYDSSCILTHTQQLVDLINPSAETINIVDIAHALSHMPRFAGHTSKLFSVAQHTLDVVVVAPKELKLQALLHDASEAYLMDIPRPLKQHLSEYKIIEERMMNAIARRFGLKYPFDAKIKEIDNEVLSQEMEWVFYGTANRFWTPEEVKTRFLNTFISLTAKNNFF